LALVQPLPRSVGEAAESSARSPFEQLDDRIRAGDARGLIVVRVADAGDALAIAGHVERRCRSLGRTVARSAHARVESGWRDVARRLGIEPVPHDPSETARAIARRTEPGRGVVITTLLDAQSWDTAVSDALAKEIDTTLVVVIGDSSVAPYGEAAVELPARLDEAGLTCWWDAVAEQQCRDRGGVLTELERWLEHAAAQPPVMVDPEALQPASRELLGRLQLGRRAWPLRELAALGDAEALAPLVAAGLVESRDGLLAVRDGAVAVPGIDPIAVAAELERHFETDPWAFARAAELYASGGAAERAERAMAQSLGLAADADSRFSLWRRWAAVVEALPEEAGQLARVNGAELALDLGDVEVALEWAERASGAEPRVRAAFVLGRAALARGDLVSADAALSRALSLAERDRAMRLEVLSVIAEVRYAGGELDTAEQIANEVVQAASDARVRLSARNLLGKLLLARGRWSEADQHFAVDACEAACSADLVSELRARLNRAIALLSSGAAEQARALLEQVLATGELRGEPRAVAFALTNLAVLAIERHEYAHALELSERAIALRRRLGDRLGFVRTVQNVVELRLRLGLVDQADQALRFGRNALGPGVPPARLCGLALCAARIHLERGHTLEAEREVRAALRMVAGASNADKVGECHRIAARVALEDGLTARAEAELSAARAAIVDAYAKAEVALLEALIARAAGRSGLDLAETAVETARAAGDDELAREAHVLAAEIALAEQDQPTAAEHVAAAAALRNEIAQGLGAALREAYLGRRDMLRLARLERATQQPEPLSEPISLPPPSPAAPRAPLSYVGRHPRVVSLLDSARRVARTNATVLICGESGTGKELVSELLHAASERASGPLVKVNCAALVETLLLSELFGHEKGAFTGAASRKRGRFERANGGTLFLDEIGDISPRTQVALLRVLEERTIERVGGSAPLPVDVRIVCATNRDLRLLVEAGQFRQDLYYRLCGITLEVPPLRERVSDLPLVCDALLARIARERKETQKKLAPDALELLARHRWPGNVRELENALRAATLFADGESVTALDLVEHVEALRKAASEPAPISRIDARNSSAPPAPLTEPMLGDQDGPASGVAYREIRGGVSLSDLKRNIERDCIAKALEETQGNITRAATLLGMKRPRLSQLVKQYGLLDSDEEES
jgi:transcriptional regulator with GAF, ATPase, and Fis domain/tetratricopeptide (TPR) repeat protein